MAKQFIRFSLLLLLLTVTLFATSACVFDCFGVMTTAEDTTTNAPTVTTAPESTTAETTKPPITAAPVTTEEVYRPGTPGLILESSGDGTAKVMGITDNAATTIEIPEYTTDGDRVIEIVAGAFSQNAALEELILPKNVYKIGANAFFGCEKLKSISFSEGLDIIGLNAFSGCTALETLHFPASLSELAPAAFSGCTALKHLTVADGGSTFRHEGNCLIQKNGNVLVLGTAGSKIPKTVEAIGEQAFYNMGVTGILMPDSVKSVGKQAFGMNPALSTLVLSESLTELSDLAFYRCTALTAVYLPESLTHIGLTPFRGCAALTRLTVAKDNPTYTVEGNCLIEKETLTLVQGFVNSVIPASVKAIGNAAFSMMPVTAVTLPDGCVTIGAEAFAHTYALKAITLPATLTEIHATAFRYANALTTLTYQGSEEAFSALTEGVTLPEGVTVIYTEE